MQLSIIDRALARVVARLEELGWEDELKKHKDWYEGIQGLPPMNSSKPVTDKGTVLPQECSRCRCPIFNSPFSLVHMQRTYTPVHDRPTGQTISRGTHQDDQVSVPGN